MRNKIDIEVAKKLRQQGLTFQAIGAAFGTSRQTIEQALSKSSRNYHRQHLLKINGKYVKGNKRPYPHGNQCELCGEVVKKLDYHHWDDNHLEKGIWICLPCHRFVARIDKGLQVKYAELREGIDKRYKIC